MAEGQVPVAVARHAFSTGFNQVVAASDWQIADIEKQAEAWNQRTEAHNSLAYAFRPIAAAAATQGQLETAYTEKGRLARALEGLQKAHSKKCQKIKSALLKVTNGYELLAPKISKGPRREMSSHSDDVELSGLHHRHQPSFSPFDDVELPMIHGTIYRHPAILHHVTVGLALLVLFWKLSAPS